MKNVVIAVFIAVLAMTGISNAEEKNFGPKDRYCVIEKVPTATGPVGAVVEAMDVFAGKITSAVEIALTGERKITVENETGESRIFPLRTTTKIVDSTLNTATFNELKEGERVKVDYTKEGGIDTAKEVAIQK